MGARTAAKVSRVLRSSQLSKISWLVHGFSTRQDGVSKAYGGWSLNLGFTKHDSRLAVERNRQIFLRQLDEDGRKSWPLVTLRQIHSDLIHRIDTVAEHPLTGDGLITSTPGILLAVQTADCLPLILVDVRQHAIGVFHAGWRGTLQRIAQKGVGEMRRFFGTEPQNIKAAIGPGIHSCCYQVGAEVREQFESQFAHATILFREVKESDPIREKYPLLFLSARPPGHSEWQTKIFLDLVEANRRQLMEVGVAPKNISASDLCSACRPDLLFSYRADKGVTGRMMGVVGIHRKP